MLNFFRRSEKKYQDISANEFEALLAGNPNVALVDVRRPGEYAAGHIPGAININVMAADFMVNIDRLPKDQAVYVYCQSGNRSKTACGIMDRNGFTDLYNVKGGMMAWRGETTQP